MSVVFWITSVFLCYATIGKVPGIKAVIHWTLTFTTDTNNIASSNANQRLILRGTLASTDTIDLDEYDNFTRFEKGCVDIFNVETLDIGNLTNATFWNDKTGSGGPIWNIKEVELYNHEYNYTHELYDVKVQGIKSIYYITKSVIYTTEMSTINPSTEPLVTTFVSTEVTEEEITTESFEPTVENKVEITTSRLEETTQPEMCYCKCHSSVNRTKEEEEKYVQELKKALTIPKKNMSSYIRKKISAPDHRPSAQAAGYIGVIFIILPFLLIVVGDFIKLMAFCCKSK